MLQPAINGLAEDGPTDADLKAGYCYNVLKDHSANTCPRQTIPAILADVCKKIQSDSQRLEDYLSARGYLFGPKDPMPIMIAGSRGDADVRDCKQSVDHPTPELASCEKKCDIRKSDWTSCITPCAPSSCRRLWTCNDLNFLPF